MVAYRAMKATKLNAPEEFVDKLLPKDLIELNLWEREAATVLIPNKDGKFRFFIDYRIMIAQTVKISWPLPRVQDVLGSFHGSCYFPYLGLAMAFHQIEIQEKDQHLTSSITPFGLYQ